MARVHQERGSTIGLCLWLRGLKDNSTKCGHKLRLCWEGAKLLGWNWTAMEPLSSWRRVLAAWHTSEHFGPDISLLVLELTA